MSDAKRDGKVKLDLFEIESLNVDQLDVEELEQRIELSAGVPTEMGWTCSCDSECNSLCTSYCSTQCTCDGTNTCTTYCGSDCSTLCSYLCSADCGADVCAQFDIKV